MPYLDLLSNILQANESLYLFVQRDPHGHHLYLLLLLYMYCLCSEQLLKLFLNIFTRNVSFFGPLLPKALATRTHWVSENSVGLCLPWEVFSCCRKGLCMSLHTVYVCAHIHTCARFRGRVWLLVCCVLAVLFHIYCCSPRALLQCLFVDNKNYTLMQPFCTAESTNTTVIQRKTQSA